MHHTKNSDKIIDMLCGYLQKLPSLSKEQSGKSLTSCMKVWSPMLITIIRRKDEKQQTGADASYKDEAYGKDKGTTDQH